MKKIFLIAALALPLLWTSCGNGGKEENPLADSLSNVNNGLNSKVSDQEKTINDFVTSFNEIQDNLDAIKEKEKIVSKVSMDGDVKSKEGQIVDDLQAIYDLMNKNKQKIANMSAKLKKANGRIEELEKMLTRLQTQIEEKDGQIAELKAQLEKMNVELANLQTNYEEVKQESEIKTAVINTAFYAYGTKKELIKQGVLTKEGGFAGLGKSTKLKDDFNKQYFTKVDIQSTNEITLACKKAKLVTNHPSESYKFDGEQGKKIEKIIITDADNFWSSSKYLVVVVE